MNLGEILMMSCLGFCVEEKNTAVLVFTPRCSLSLAKKNIEFGDEHEYLDLC